MSQTSIYTVAYTHTHTHRLTHTHTHRLTHRAAPPVIHTQFICKVQFTFPAFVRVYRLQDILRASKRPCNIYLYIYIYIYIYIYNIYIYFLQPIRCLFNYSIIYYIYSIRPTRRQSNVTDHFSRIDKISLQIMF